MHPTIDQRKQFKKENAGNLPLTIALVTEAGSQYVFPDKYRGLNKAFHEPSLNQICSKAPPMTSEIYTLPVLKSDLMHDFNTLQAHLELNKWKWMAHLEVCLTI